MAKVLTIADTRRMSKDDADDIKFLAENGKMELEYSAKKFLENLNK